MSQDTMFTHLFSIMRVVRKTENRFGFGFNFTCIQSADKCDTRFDCYSLLTTVTKSDMHSSFNMAVML